MAYISHFHLEDLAGRTKPLSLRLNRQVNVFFGTNGSGKTSLLRTLHSALANDPKSLAKIPVGSATVKISEASLEDFHWLTDEQEITRSTILEERLLFDDSPRFTLAGERAKRKAWASYSDFPEAVDKAKSIEHVYLPITRLYATEEHRPQASLKYRVGGASALSETDLDSIFVEAVNLLWLRYTRNLLADVRSAQEAGLNSILYNVLSSETSQDDAQQIQDPKLAYKRLVSFLNRQDSLGLEFYDEEDFTRRLESSGLMRNVVTEIERVEQRVERAQRPRNQFEKLLRQMIGGSKVLQLGDKDIHFESSRGEEVELGSLSSGEKQLLRICLEALFAGQNPIIIDEPELSMHIDWQRRLVQSLRLLSPESQIIIATHSPEIMAELSEEHIFEI